jgi:uncharacterized membrane protein HdeD (DUF308 family)
MSTFDTRPASSASRGSGPPGWIKMLLGLGFILGGLLVLGDITTATLISAFVIGVIAIAVGVFEILHAFWTKGWGGFVWQALLGALYVAFGIALVTRPVSGAFVLTYLLGLVLMISGIARVLMGFSHWAEAGWIMLLSGVFGILAGLIILTGFPLTGLWVLGLLLGIDLIWHGVAWIAYAWMPAARTA